MIAPTPNHRRPASQFPNPLSIGLEFLGDAVELRMFDRFRHRRPHALTTGTITPSDMMTVRCVILNISEDGACLLVRDADAVPPVFQLMIDQAKTIHRCRVKWSTGNRLGVVFAVD
jgi:hypothetical protein